MAGEGDHVALAELVLGLGQYAAEVRHVGAHCVVPAPRHDVGRHLDGEHGGVGVTVDGERQGRRLVERLLEAPAPGAVDLGEECRVPPDGRELPRVQSEPPRAAAVGHGDAHER